MIPDSCAGSLRPPRAPAARGVTSKIALLGPCAGGRPARPGPRPAAWAKGAADRPNDSLFTCFTSGLWGNLDFFILLFYFFPPEGFRARGAAPGARRIRSGRDPRPDPAPDFAAARRGCPAPGRPQSPHRTRCVERGPPRAGPNAPFPHLPYNAQFSLSRSIITALLGSQKTLPTTPDKNTLLTFFFPLCNTTVTR